MGHRLPVNMLFVPLVLSACSGPTNTNESSATTSDPGTTHHHDGDDDDAVHSTSDTTTTYGPPEDEYAFEFVVDGNSTTVYASLMGLVKNSGADCTTSYTLSLVGNEFENRIFMAGGIDDLPAVGVEGPLGTDSPGDNRRATLWVWEIVGPYLVENTYSSPKWTIISLGIDELELTLDPGTICPFVAGPGDDTSGCIPFTSATLRLVDAPRGFDPSLHCFDEALGDGGERCFDHTLRQPENPPFCL